PGWALAAWAVCRLLGTALVVPVVEELLFRSYLVEKLDLRARLGPILGLTLAVAVSTALFAALHDRWIAAAMSGLVFAGFALRRGRITDAIWCHAAANAVIGIYALISGQWSLI
ncbi:MAG TPA: CAAX prenyl protease-related protein, partial [Paracoccaceae bacterium]|nr:CAAX prenyl protease-related protein [Paracoccaceae bacterium]